MKTCTKCGAEKEISLFAIFSKSRDGRSPWCRSCKAVYDSSYQKKNMPKITTKTRAWYLKNKARMDLWHAEYREKNKQKIRSKNLARNRSNRTKIAAYERCRRASDPLYRLIKNCRTRLYHAVKRGGWVKPGRTQELLGAPFPVVKSWIEWQFQPGMSWDNYGKWHVDHYIPLSSARCADDIFKLANYKNLQPLWAEDNLVKGKKEV